MATTEDRSKKGAAQSCDGHGLKLAARAAMVWLERNYEHVNALNVFPVPDGDTGTNMLLTMRSAYNEISALEEKHAGLVAKKLYQGALMGARGNSGVILSQLWFGLSKAIEDDATLDEPSIVRGLIEASRTAYRAVQEPVEGTILTVSREIAEEAEKAVLSATSMESFLEQIVERSHEAVQRTPEQLAVLKEAGVVDSGGMGLTYLLEGVLRFVRGETLDLTDSAPAPEASLQSALAPTDEFGYGYDVQFLIKGSEMNVARIRADIEAMGDSTLVVGDADLIKVHVHVPNPGVPVGYGADQGILLDVVVENMDEQYEEFVDHGGPQMSPQVVEHLIEPPEIEPGSVAVVTVAPGEGLKRIFYSVGAGHVISGGQTMNPSTEDFVDAIKGLTTDKIILLPNNKNVLMSAEAAAKFVNGKSVQVIPTRTIPQGIAALLALNPHGTLDDNASSMDSAIKYVETGEVTTATRAVKIDGLAVSKDQIIGLHNDVLRVAGSSVSKVVFDLLSEMGADELELITLYYGSDVVSHEAEQLGQQIREMYPDHEIELRDGGQAHYHYIISAE